LEFVFDKQSRPITQAEAMPVKKPRKPSGKTIREISITDIERQALPGESYETAAARIADKRKRDLLE
jgi:hypothetical protein